MCNKHYRKQLYAKHKAEGRLNLYNGTWLSPESRALLQKVGITYRQWNYWHSKGWLTGSFENVDEQALERLAHAAHIQSLPLNELADLLATKELERL